MSDQVLRRPRGTWKRLGRRGYRGELKERRWGEWCIGVWRGAVLGYRAKCVGQTGRVGREGRASRASRAGKKPDNKAVRDLDISNTKDYNPVGSQLESSWWP